MKKYIVILASIISLIMPVSVHAAVTMYEKVQSEEIGVGIIYESSKRVTDAGLLDVYVLKVDLRNPNLSIKPVSSVIDVGLKEYTSKLLNDNGAVGGVNADFFGMAGAYSWTVGPEVADGRLKSADRINNSDKNKYASLMLDNNNNPLIEYVKTYIEFLINGEERIQVFNYNKVTDLTYATYIDQTLMKDTLSIDNRFPNTMKIVVRNGVVTKVSGNGETVFVPEDGFIILVKQESSDYFRTLVNVGDSASVSVNSNIDLSKMRSGISGGGKLLVNGEVVNDGGFVPTGRQPRTAVGYTPDRSQLIVMVVDGRSHSIGATHAEMAHLMLHYGATDAMHFDGGGSSTMAVKMPGEDGVSVVNEPSQGSQRKVINALGVFNVSPNNFVNKIMIKPTSNRVFLNTGVPLNIFGVDHALNTAPLTSPAIYFDDIGAVFKDGYFYPSREGQTTVSVHDLALTAQTELTVLNLAELIPEHYNIFMGVGEEYPLNFTGRSTYGFFAPIFKGVKYEVVPSDLGFVNNDHFVSLRNGAGYIKCSVGDIVSYIDVNVGVETRKLAAFDSNTAIEFLGHPATVIGNAKAGSPIYMEYEMPASDTTQAAYVRFTDPIYLPEDAYAVKLRVWGDNSSSWLRMKIVDGDGEAHLLDLAHSVDWEGDREVSALLPYGLTYPVYIERIYIANLSNPVATPILRIGFGDLYTESIVQYEPLEHDPATEFYDPLDSPYSFVNGSDILIFGETEPPKKATNTLMQAFVNIKQGIVKRIGTNAAVSAGAGSFYTDSVVQYYGNGYDKKQYKNALILRMKSSRGGFLDTDAYQWTYFFNDIKNSDADHVIITTDISPLNFDSFKEYEYFQDALTELSQTGRNIFVISTETGANYALIENGIRYLNIAPMYEGGVLNPYASFVRISIDGKNINYAFERIPN